MNQDKASGGEGLSDETEFELHCNGDYEASAIGPREQAWAEIQHYAAQYQQDGPVVIYEVTRTPVVAGEGSGGVKGNAPDRQDVQFLIDLAGQDHVAPFTRRMLARIARKLASGTPVGSEGQRQEGEAEQQSADLLAAAAYLECEDGCVSMPSEEADRIAQTLRRLAALPSIPRGGEQ